MEVKSEADEDLENGKLVGLNIFEKVMEYKDRDIVVFFYRSTLDGD